MKSRDPADSSPDESRAHALGLAIALRDYSLSSNITKATRTAYRTLMRVQAINWRQPRALNGTQGNCSP